MTNSTKINFIKRVQFPLIMFAFAGMIAIGIALMKSTGFSAWELVAQQALVFLLSAVFILRIAYFRYLKFESRPSYGRVLAEHLTRVRAFFVLTYVLCQLGFLLTQFFGRPEVTSLLVATYLLWLALPGVWLELSMRSCAFEFRPDLSKIWGSGPHIVLSGFLISTAVEQVELQDKDVLASARDLKGTGRSSFSFLLHLVAPSALFSMAAHNCNLQHAISASFFGNAIGLVGQGVVFGG